MHESSAKSQQALLHQVNNSQHQHLVPVSVNTSFTLQNSNGNGVNNSRNASAKVGGTVVYRNNPNNYLERGSGGRNQNKLITSQSQSVKQLTKLKAKKFLAPPPNNDHQNLVDTPDQLVFSMI